MSITEFGALGEGIGSLLILVTLIYLAIQNKQHQKLLLSTAYQARTDTTLSLYSLIVSNPQFAEILAKQNEEKALTPAELVQRQSFQTYSLKALENMHFQHQLGALSDEHMVAFRD